MTWFSWFATGSPPGDVFRFWNLFVSIYARHVPQPVCRHLDNKGQRDTRANGAPPFRIVVMSRRILANISCFHCWSKLFSLDRFCWRANIDTKGKLSYAQFKSNIHAQGGSVRFWEQQTINLVKRTARPFISKHSKSADPSIVGVPEFMLLSLLSQPNWYPLLPTLCNSRYCPILRFSYALIVLSYYRACTFQERLNSTLTAYAYLLTYHTTFTIL